MAPRKTETKTFVVAGRVPAELYKRIHDMATSDDRTIANVVARLLRSALQKQASTAREV